MSTTTPQRTAKPTAPPVTSIRVYNTLSRTKEPLATVKPGQVGIYLCGPTVYDKAHMGHMVGPVIFDTIKRYLTYSGYKVTWVVNITDVDDKLIRKSGERGISMAALAEEMTQDYLSNLAGMGVDQIDRMPKATECMGDIIKFVEALIARGFAYESAGDVYFDVAKDSGYGKLTNRTLDALQGEGGDTAARKRSPHDFALWKRTKPGEPSWDSPWGAGRPGWHIECSAMSKSILGETFDIHGGGLDLIFPHHENEIAQSECCHGKPMAKYWMHNGLLKRSAEAGKIGGRSERDAAPTQPNGVMAEAGGYDPNAADDKESRSKGAGGLAELLAQQGGERIRFFLLRTHYRSTVLFSDEAIAEAATGLDSFYRLFKRIERITGRSFYDLPTADRTSGCLEKANHPTLKQVQEARERFLAAMDDDFNTGGAIGELFELARAINKLIDDEKLEDGQASDPARHATLLQAACTLRELSATLGLFLQPVVRAAGADDKHVAGVMQLILELRAAARAKKDFATADKIRAALGTAGVALTDRAGETEWDASAAPAGGPLAELMKLVVELRAAARAAKDFATADQIRAGLTTAGITLADRAGETEWTI
ncbi:MAG: cysteine--tRNA ligase [Planctomycetia bacterium]|nr:cysteine--tRNA ligase [Planctomycetia bacterium]